MMEVALGISVFPDSALYDVAVTKCMGRVPASVYITAQGVNLKQHLTVVWTPAQRFSLTCRSRIRERYYAGNML